MDHRRKAALTACSNLLADKRRDDIDKLQSILEAEGLEVEASPCLFGCGGYTSGREKAEILNGLFRDPEMAFIFDVSGGDLANTVLPYLDYDAVRASRALFFGYSDLTTVMNAIYARAGKETVNWQVRNLVYDHAPEQLSLLREHILTDNLSPDLLEVQFLRGSRMRGRILGGNIRCFLKLAGTPYWPDLRGAILLLEALGSGPELTVTALQQYRQMGVFDQVQGIVLGTFTRMEEEGNGDLLRELVLEMTPPDLPVAQTRYIGHGTDARAVLIGREAVLREEGRDET